MFLGKRSCWGSVFALSFFFGLAVPPASAVEVVLHGGVTSGLPFYSSEDDKFTTDVDESSADRGNIGFIADGSIIFNIRQQLTNGVMAEFFLDMNLYNDRNNEDGISIFNHHPLLDETYGQVSGSFGMVQFGANDGAAAQLVPSSVGCTAFTCASAATGVSFDYRNNYTGGFDWEFGSDTGDAVKLSYFSPSVYGFKFGGSYTIDDSIGDMVSLITSPTAKGGSWEAGFLFDGSDFTGANELVKGFKFGVGFATIKPDTGISRNTNGIVSKAFLSSDAANTVVQGIADPGSVSFGKQTQRFDDTYLEYGQFNDELTWTVGGSYTLGNLTFGGGYENRNYDTKQLVPSISKVSSAIDGVSYNDDKQAAKESSWNAGASYKYGALNIGLNYAKQTKTFAKEVPDSANTKVDKVEAFEKTVAGWSIGVDYDFGEGVIVGATAEIKQDIGYSTTGGGVFLGLYF